jgi:hypothetical protein
MLSDPLFIIGVFMLGASAGSLLTHVRHHGMISRDREIQQYGTTQHLHTDEIFGFRVSKWVNRKLGQPSDTYSGVLSGTPNGPEMGQAVIASADSELAGLEVDRVPIEINAERASA